jgi:hypothetical protein
VDATIVTEPTGAATPLIAAVWIGIDIALLVAAADISTNLCLLALAAMIVQAVCLFAFSRVRAETAKREIVTRLSGCLKNLGETVSGITTAASFESSFSRALADVSDRLDQATRQLQQPVPLVADTASPLIGRLELLHSLIKDQNEDLQACIAKIAQPPAAQPTQPIQPTQKTLLNNLEGHLLDLKIRLQASVNQIAQEDGNESPKDLMLVADALKQALVSQNQSLLACCNVLSGPSPSQRNLETVARLAALLDHMLAELIIALSALKRGEHPPLTTIEVVTDALRRSQSELAQCIVSGLKAIGDPCTDIHDQSIAGGVKTDLSTLAIKMNNKASKSILDLNTELDAERDKLKKEASENALQKQITYLIRHDIAPATESLAKEMDAVQSKMTNIGILWQTANDARTLLESGAPAGKATAVAEFVPLHEMENVIRNVRKVELQRWPCKYVEQLNDSEMERWEVNFNEDKFRVIMSGLLKNAYEHGSDIEHGSHITVSLDIEPGDGKETFAVVSVTNSVPEVDVERHFAALEGQVANPMMRKNAAGKMHGGTFFLLRAAAISMSGSFNCKCDHQSITVRFLTRVHLCAHEHADGASQTSEQIRLSAAPNPSGSPMQLS